MITLRNGRWGAQISEMGAELKSLVDLRSGQEYVWNGDPAWWNGSAPELFPVIGGLKGGEFMYEGKTRWFFKEGGAPFLCIEPWHGIPDMSDTSGNLVDKEGILSLEPRAAFSTGYRVQIL